MHDGWPRSWPARCLSTSSLAELAGKRLAQAMGEAVMAVGLGGGDQLGGLVGLAAVGGQELDGGLEVSRVWLLRDDGESSICKGSLALTGVWVRGHYGAMSARVG